MFSLLGSLLGFTTSALPSVLGFFQQKSDQKHEREMAQLQIDRELALAEKGFASQERQEAIRLEEVQVQSQAQEMTALYENDSKLSEDDKAAPWIHTARASVRPVISLGLFALFVVVEIMGFAYGCYKGMDANALIDIIWDDQTQQIWSAIIMFHFGSRAFAKK
jgi:hypothetical protein